MKGYYIETTAGAPAGWETSEKAAKEAAREAPGRFVQIDVPTSKESLFPWLRERDQTMYDRGFARAEKLTPTPAGIAGGDYGGIAHSQDGLCSIDNPDAAEASPPTPPEQVTIGTNTPPTKAERAVQMNDLLAIEEWIFNAEPWQVEQAFTALGARFHEMRKATQCPES